MIEKIIFIVLFALVSVICLTEDKKMTKQTKTLNTPVSGSSAYAVVHYFNIKVLDDKRELVEFLSWSGLRWKLRMKYDWYFKYRAALLQVKYPKFQVDCFWGHEPATGKTLDEILQAKRKAKKANITKYKNKLQKAKDNWTSLFPIENDPIYKKAVAKIERLESEFRSF